jgi:hypothetical protein
LSQQTSAWLIALALAAAIGAQPGEASAGQEGTPAGGQATATSAGQPGTPAVGQAAATSAGQPGTPAGGQADASAGGQATAGGAGQPGTPNDSQPSSFKWSWGNAITYGAGIRLVDPDKRLIGLAAGGSAYSVNGDDGNLNYKKGLFSNATKITSEFEFSYKSVGGFVRGFAFYDFENEKGHRARTPLSNEAMDRVGSRAEFRDAFLWYRFKLGTHPGELRAGWQVINWGESTFIQGGINAINPVDVSVLRVPGSELRDALLPVGAVKFSLKPSANTSFEAFYQYEWQQTRIDPVGSYFSTTDLAGAGATKVMLGFGSAPDTIPVGHAPLPPSYSPVGTAVPKRATDREASNGGQYGAALRLFAPGLAGTEFGLYFINYHSRLPLIMAQTGTSAGILATGNYAATANYFLAYPEDIKLFGLGFNTQLGRTGIALQGEVSHRQDVPLQVDDVELLYAALTPLRLLPAVPQLAPLIGLGNLLASTNQVGAYGFSEEISGFRRFSTTQVQMTATKAFSRVLGASQMVLVGEAGWGKVHDLPAQSVLRLEAPGTYTTGNEIHTTNKIQPGTEPASAFPTPTAWGYVLAGRLEYNNAIGAANIIPRFSFAQDVNGISPGPGGNFLEGRKALTLGLGFQYRIKWEFDVSYTTLFGAGRYNLLNDRDFVAANIKFSF